MSISRSDAYAAAGVDVTAGYEAVDRIKPLVESTYIPGVIGTLGGFGGLFAPDVSGMKKPVLVSGTDGVGTKLKIAFLTDKHDTVGIDCVAMCVNDIVCSGARPLFFLDYLAVGKNVPSRIEAIVSGVVEGCRQAGCALVGLSLIHISRFHGTARKREPHHRALCTDAGGGVHAPPCPGLLRGPGGPSGGRGIRSENQLLPELHLTGPLHRSERRDL